jgi:hypothetical protein
VLSLASHNNAVLEVLRTGLNSYLVRGLFDVVGRIFVAALKLLVEPLVLVSSIWRTIFSPCSRCCCFTVW